MIEAAVVAAARAAPGWAALRHAERAAMLQSCADALRANLEALATLQTNESGRPLAETRLEVIVAAASFENAARFLDVSQERLISEDEEKKVVIRRMPVGVVAVIAPWNAPIVLGWKPTATALACGNPVVLKPAPQTPLTTLRIGELLRSLLPRGVLNVVVGSDLNTPRPGEILTSHDLVRKVVFTGSTAIGSKVMEACAKGFKRLLLELGGNDPAIVREDCDVEKAAEGLFKGAFFNNGQTCCAAKRIYVQEKIYDKFVKAFVARARRAVLGNGLSSGTELGPLASAVQLRHVMELVEDARRKGGRVLCGGGATAGPPGDEGSNTGLFYLPTIVVDVAEGTRLVDEEQFGPVVPVMSYKDDEEAVRRANATRYGLSASIWSQDFDKANEIANRLKAGTVWVNKHCEFIRNAPFGGIDESGIGRAGDLGEQDLNQYTEIRTLCLAKAPPKLPPDVESLQHTPEVVVEERARSALQRLFRRVRSQDALESAAQEALRVFPFQPRNLRSALTSLSSPTGSACVLLRGLPVETPIARRRLESEASLLGVLGLLGASAYALGDEEPQGLVRDVDEASEASTWHRDGRSAPSFDAPRRLFRPEKSVPDFALSMCIGEGVKGSFVDFRRLRAVADPQDVALLQKEPIAFFDSQLGLRSERVLVAASQEEDFDATRKRRVFMGAPSPEFFAIAQRDIHDGVRQYAVRVMLV
ncbi:Aldh1a3 [Symbiodinium microadriaticum]|nr:Aldh1a3 [Symbiodinium microadriaticum]